MTEQATARHVSEAAAYVQSHLDEIQMYYFGEEPEVQIDFHIPCEEDNPMVFDTLAALVPTLSQQESAWSKHVATAFKAGEFVQLSLHKEPSVELAQAFFSEALARVLEDETAAEAVAAQIAQNRAEMIERTKARMARLEALKRKKKTAS